MTKDQNEPAFKVVDRRRFTDDGDARVGDARVDVDETPRASAQSVLGNDAQPPKARPPMSFSLLVQTFAHQSMMALGIVPWPDTGIVKIDLVLARETIDILHMLKAKTKNNLDQAEQEMLDGLVYQLQTVFVEMSQNPGPTK